MPNEDVSPKAWMEFVLSNDGKIRGAFDGVPGKVKVSELLDFYNTMRKIIWKEMKNVCRNTRHPRIKVFSHLLKRWAK